MDVQAPKVYTVSELTREIQDLLEARFDFIWLEGEISNFSSPVSGHYYMVIKDERAQIRAVMFRPQVRYLKFLPENGMRVIAQGRVSVYAPRGEYQVLLDYLEPMGVGALALAFEQLKQKLASQGLFDARLKKPLPFLPRRVAVITSPTGAAIRDFLKIIGRRFANMEIIVVPVRVQGEEAAGEIAEALDLVNRALAVDVIVLTRGGGSLEDLWAFNREEVALAIRRSSIPVVSAVGHEIDVTISDLAADLRAPTPSAAAELLVREKDALRARLSELAGRLAAAEGHRLSAWGRDLARFSRGMKDPTKRLGEIGMRIDEIQARLRREMGRSLSGRVERLHSEARALRIRSPITRIRLMAQRMEFARTSLGRAMGRHMENERKATSLLDKRLRDLSPLAILGRGYSIARKLPGKAVIRAAAETAPGERIEVLLGEGELACRVEEAFPKTG